MKLCLVMLAEGSGNIKPAMYGNGGGEVDVVTFAGVQQ